MVRRRFVLHGTHEELVETLPAIHPMDRGAFMRPVPGHLGHYKFAKHHYDALEKLEWNQLYNMKEVQDRAAALKAQGGAASPASWVVIGCVSLDHSLMLEGGSMHLWGQWLYQLAPPPLLAPPSLLLHAYCSLLPWSM